MRYLLQCYVPRHGDMLVSGGVGSRILTWILDRGRWSVSRCGRLNSEERACLLTGEEPVWAAEALDTWGREDCLASSSIDPDSPAIQPVAKDKKVNVFVNTPWRDIGGVNLLGRNICTRWRWMVSFTLRPLYRRRKSFRYLLNRRLDGPQNQCRHFDGLQNLLRLPGIEFLLSSS